MGRVFEWTGRDGRGNVYARNGSVAQRRRDISVWTCWDWTEWGFADYGGDGVCCAAWITVTRRGWRDEPLAVQPMQIVYGPPVPPATRP